MEKWISGMEHRLPMWLEKTQVQWVQWVYALWQLIRCNQVALLLLSYVPFMLSQYYRKKAVVVVGSSREYYMQNEEMLDYFEGAPVRLKNIEEISAHREEDKSDLPNWHIVKYNHYYYIAHINALCDLKKCSELFGENIIFVERLLKVSGSIAVGKRLSETEAYEKILSKRYFCSRGANLVVPTSFNYVDFSSKFWVVISSLPILLQAKSYVKLSGVLSLVIILLDLNRGRLYRLYDRLFNSFVRIVKLNVFKERTNLYDFFLMFSNLWECTDSVKKHAYVTKPGDRLKISQYSKLERPDDIEIVGWERYNRDPNDQNIFMEINKDEVHCNLMRYNGVYAVVELRRPVYVL
ncbi:uncharacterized protein LOC131056854 [Cryptomeria japonica]|uniref:uncharacterized protein LOC131056854 n=1 Tax=Cryptomeria japonica TaxID=3369 RepID=UPI0027DA4814|nr:uncharacterized protein LOC131056854 [Cryptomeria japonica]